MNGPLSGKQRGKACTNFLRKRIFISVHSFKDDFILEDEFVNSQKIRSQFQRKSKDVEFLTLVSYCFKKMHFLFVLVTLPSSSAVNILRLHQFLVLIMYLCFPSIFIVAELIVHSIHTYTGDQVTPIRFFVLQANPEMSKGRSVG